MIPSPRSQVRSWAQAHSPTATVGLFQGSSGNALTNSAANAAHRDIWNVGNVHIYPSHALHAGQGLSSLPQQPLSIFSYILSTFTTLVARTAVTLGSPQYGAPYATMLPNPSATPSFDVAQLPDPTNGSSERRSAQAADEIPSEATEGAEIKSGDFEIKTLTWI
ncbi:hypothetical protein BKA70DRAFT_1343118 [Coprinopsis sp. MPI-PUGE-AT-0042]|nr:hypothetical protein BKA70DRAFT_1343118 [Coprinopsis sp. MPI-PUGE-AT-0042]